MRPSIRLAAMQGFHVIYVFTHDSIGLGEDGPTHQPVEHLAALRAIPGLAVVRPADANETSAAWREAVARRNGPVALVLSRQKLPILEGTQARAREAVARGAYVVADADPIDAILLATGSEVSLAIEARARLAAEGIGVRVVSMPCWEWFEAQDAAWRESVLPARVTKRVAIEAAVPLGWERWVGTSGAILGMHRFGASARYETLLEKFGFTADRVVEKTREVIGRG
jgi:transketolase